LEKFNVGNTDEEASYEFRVEEEKIKIKKYD
jgi:hypothetical protein